MNIKKTEVTEESLAQLVTVGLEYMEELREMLSDIKVPARSVNPDVLEAIRTIFGDEYVTNEESYITFDMFVDCSKILRNIGRATAAEFA